MTEPLLETEGLCKSFGALQATDHVDISLRPGEIHALIGPNGAGKSTLVKLIMGALRPTAGRIRFAGQDITQWRTPQRARAGLGRTFQISSLAMEHTVLQNAVLGALGRRGDMLRFLRPVMRDSALVARAEDALARVGLEDLRTARTGELSHGQRRLLEVAVALTLEPKAFLMDEPMAGLGADGSHRMTAFLDELRHQAPILLIEHDMDAVFRLADRISVLVYGRVIATGTAEEIRANPDVREAYLGEEDAA